MGGRALFLRIAGHHALERNVTCTWSAMRGPFSRHGHEPMESHPHVTQLLERARRGDRDVADELMPLIYDELRRLAQHHLHHEGPGHTLQATALVNETYLRLVGSDCPWQDRAHFFAVAATTIRRILVQHARRKGSLKRGGDRVRLDIDPAELQRDQEDVDARVLAVDEALNRLAEIDPEKARLVELRFFAGLTVEETAEALAISPRTAAREWQVARAWLSRALSEDGDG